MMGSPSRSSEGGRRSLSSGSALRRSAVVAGLAGTAGTLQRFVSVSSSAAAADVDEAEADDSPWERFLPLPSSLFACRFDAAFDMRCKTAEGTWALSGSALGFLKPPRSFRLSATADMAADPEAREAGAEA